MNIDETAELLARHTPSYTHWGTGMGGPNKPAATICRCKAETPIMLPGPAFTIPDADLHEAERAAHARHLAQVLAEDGYRRLRKDGQVREIVIPAPNVPYKGVDLRDAHYMRTAAHNLENGFGVGGRNVTNTIITVLRDVANATDALDPVPTA